MKRILFLLFVFTTFSCSYNEGGSNNLSTNQIKSKLLVINSKFKSQKSEFSRPPFKSFCAIFAADVGGAWAGTWAGGKVGAFFGHPEIGAVAGAVIVGGAASYGASRPAAIGQTLNMNLIESIDASERYENPYNNPFDYQVGLRHNEILKNLILNNNYDNFELSKLFSFVSITDNEALFLRDRKEQTLDFCNTYSNNNSIDQQKIMLKNYINDDKLLTVMYSYMDGIIDSSSDDAQKITAEYENFIINSNDFDKTQKNILLQGFSVARYSINFWIKVIKQ